MENSTLNKEWQWDGLNTGVYSVNGFVCTEPFPPLESNMTGQAFLVPVTQVGLVRLKVLAFCSALENPKYVWVEKRFATEGGWASKVYNEGGKKFLLVPASEVKLCRWDEKGIFE